MTMDKPNDLPWSVQIETGRDGRWRRVRWTLTAEGLSEALLGPLQPSVLRSTSPAGVKSVLLLSDVITLADGLVAMNILAARESAGTLAVEARLTAERKFTTPLQATLEWGQRRLGAPVNETGSAIFRGLPIDSLLDLDNNRALADLKVIIERAAGE